MSPRTGRPKIEHPKEQRFSIRLDDRLASKLDAYCESVGKKRAIVIREAIESFLDDKK